MSLPDHRTTDPQTAVPLIPAGALTRYMTLDSRPVPAPRPPVQQPVGRHRLTWRTRAGRVLLRPADLRHDPALWRLLGRIDAMARRRGLTGQEVAR